jgi:3-dehydroquinate synthase
MTDRGQVSVETPHGSYDVLIGPGLLDDLPTLIERSAPAHRYALIADDRVARLYGERVVTAMSGARVDLLTFPAGESQKSRESWSDLSDRMFAAGMGRDAAVIALGGGVTGDLAGFVAATYMRGLPVVQIPTTLLAMIDSSVGGKTGVDTPAGKNLIGAFLQPRLVVADTEVLRTLPGAELRAGMAEAIKHGAIADAEYFEWMRPMVGEEAPGADFLAKLVLRSVQIKAEVVGRDEREAGPRKMLNFGHTVGHAVESLSGFRLLHGEAIAIGMVVEGAIGERLGVTAPGTTEALRETIEAAGLPARVPAEFAPERIVEATRSDKKARQGRVEYSLIEQIGSASPGPDGRWGWGVDDEVVLDSIRDRSEK